jgi:hypothetical protein
MDGAPAREPPLHLDGASELAVLTSVRVVDAADVERGSAAASCLSEFDELAAAGPVVTRVGVDSASVTFAVAHGRALAGCNDSPGPRERGRRWCGNAYGQLYGGRLRDPRLSIVCRTGDGEPTGSAWVSPGPGTRYVSVERGGFVEVFEVAGDLPVRVATTSGVQSEGSRATFELAEHDARGRLLRRYRLDTAVAG